MKQAENELKSNEHIDAWQVLFCIQ